MAEPGDILLQRRGGGGSQLDNFKRLKDQVQILKKQLEDERREQKKLLEVLTSVIKGEESCVSIDKAVNILVFFLYSCTAIHMVLLRWLSNCKVHWLQSRIEMLKLHKEERL